jgi:hypothetical protein
MTSAAITGIVLAIPALVDLTIKYARKFVSKVQVYRRATGLYGDDLELQDIQAGQLVICLEFVQDAAPSFTDDVNDMLHKTLSRLTRSLEMTIITLERGLDKEGNVRRLWYTTLGKSALKRDLYEVEKNQVLFQRGVQLATLFGGPGVALHMTKDRLSGNTALARVQRLREAIQNRLSSANTPEMLLKENDIPAGRRRRLPYSDGVKLVLSETSDYPLALIETREQEISDTRKIRDIALILNGTDASMAMIQCRGFFPVEGTNRCQLVFPLPQNSVKPRTLRELLLSPENDVGMLFSLNSRIRLAQRLATAVLFTHTAKVVHKNIRPENIITLSSATLDADPRQDRELGDSFLMGFDFARKETESSERVGDDCWHRNIYRHPQRQGVHLEVDFTFLHDIYSLGVVLLEIALWRSFVLIEKDPVYGSPKYVVNRDVCRFFDRKSGLLKESHEIWKMFIKKTEGAVTQALGNKYRDTVLMCLRCLDEGFGDPTELVDQDGVLVGLAYIERVLMTLDEIVV